MTYNETIYNGLGALGYTGTLNERINQYRNDLGLAPGTIATVEFLASQGITTGTYNERVIKFFRGLFDGSIILTLNSIDLINSDGVLLIADNP